MIGVMLCIHLAGAAEEASFAAPVELRIVCDGITTASLAGQDLLYSGTSEFRWESLQVRLTGQLHVFCGVSLSQTGDGVRGQFEIQSITGNGNITVSWEDGKTVCQFQGTRLTVRPRLGVIDSGFVVLDGLIDEAGQPLPGKLKWDSALRRWVAWSPPNAEVGK